MNRLTPSEVIRPTPVYVTGADARFSANDEPEDDEAAIFEEAEEDDDICVSCNGSGEGQYDGTRCRSCGGSGVERTCRDEPDYDAMRKDRIERELAAEWAEQNGDVE